VAPSVVAPDQHVTLRYVLFDQDSGAQLSLGDEEGPVSVEYVHGYGQVLPAIERALEGVASGERMVVTATPADAFGEYEAEGRFELDKSGLEGSEELEVGEEFVASGPDGDFVMRVLEVRDESLVVDTNHPLAGKRIRFEIEVVEVRPATDDELVEAEQALEHDHECGCGEPHDHAGHAHGPDGAVAAEPLVQLGTRRGGKILS
jgi:FKBP-type peptidyl-prolyl cis-trans isomerase SlyD